MTEVRILYRDEWLAVAHKPSGLSVHRGWDRAPQVAMLLVRDLLGQHVWPVHRLDRSASGVLVFALDRGTAREMHGIFARGEVDKRYLALVRGSPPMDGIIDHPLRRTADGPRVEAVTEYHRRHTYVRDDLPRTYALVEVKPRTGRLHQIRRHFHHISHPLIGDVRYGKGEHNRLFRERFGLHRLFLHATAIEFSHPVIGQPLTVEDPLPGELRAVLDQL